MDNNGKKIDIDHGYEAIELHVFRPARLTNKARMYRYFIPQEQWGTPRGARRLRRFVRMMSANIRSYWEE
jgi:hypothetical protein